MSPKPTQSDLLGARANLKPAFRDKALVEKFTKIRNLNLVFGVENEAATLTVEELELLKSLVLRSAPRMDVAPSIKASTFGGGTKAGMDFNTIFQARVEAALPNRVIRFVKAAQVNRNFGETKAEYTVAGYVHYSTGSSSKVKSSATPNYFRTKLIENFNRAQWSFDGPRQEFIPGQGLKNHDSPGTQASALPYGITAEFLTVLYEEKVQTVIEVGHAVGSLGVWRDMGAGVGLNRYEYVFVRAAELPVIVEPTLPTGGAGI